MSAWWFALLGCGATGLTTGWPTGPYDTATPDCATPVVGTSPSGGAVSRHRRVTVDLPVDRSVVGHSVDISVERETPRGLEAVPGTVDAHHGAVVRVEFVPLEPLVPLTRHAVRASTPDCGVIAAFEFTTSEIGLPVDDPREAVGHPFVGNAANASQVGRELVDVDLAPTGAIRFVIEDLSARSIVMTSTRQPLDVYQGADPPVYLVGEWTNPSFRLFGERFPMHLVGGMPVDLTDVEFTGDLSPDRRQLAGLVVRGTLDLRAIDPSNPTDLCADLAEDGDCRECGDGEPLCVVAQFRDWAAQRVDEDPSPP